jgi:hypothetical protein
VTTPRLLIRRGMPTRRVRQTRIVAQREAAERAPTPRFAGAAPEFASSREARVSAVGG